MKKTILALLLLAFAKIATAQAPAAPKRKPTLGISAGYFSGNYKFPDGAIYAQSPLDQFSGSQFGGYLQLDLSSRFWLQPEVNFYTRAARSDFEYIYKIELINSTEVKYRVNGEQPTAELGILGFYKIGDKRWQPFVGGGLGIGIRRKKSIFQETSPKGAPWKQSDIRTKEGDTGLLVGAGVVGKLFGHLQIKSEARFGLAGTNWITEEFEIKKATIPTNVSVRRFIVQVGLGWAF